jgi:hypothetical protein
MDTEDVRPKPGVPLPAFVGDGTTIYQGTDPLGFVINLDSHTWNSHIVRYHPEMSRHLENVKLTVEAPELIQRKSGTIDTAYYYRLTSSGSGSGKHLYIGLVVEHEAGTKTGRVKTAHLLKRLRSSSGEVLWISKNWRSS